MFTFLALQEVSAQTDSIHTESLPEIIVNADVQIETSEKTVLLPTTMEKKHSANGFDLLNVMQVTELEVSPYTRTITTHNGKDIVLCINGVEVLPEDVATLRSKNIHTIEYIRTPSGKYAGKGGLINFITIRLEYGGNVYLSARESFGYNMGDYLTFTDFVKKGLTLSLTASGDWARDHSYTEGYETYTFADQAMMTRNLTCEESLRKSNNEALRFRLTSTGKNYRLNAYANLTHQAVPSTEQISNIQYSGKYNDTTQRLVKSGSRGLAPSLYVNYTLWLPKDHTLDFTASASLGHNKYNSLYQETAQLGTTSVVIEDNNTIHGNARYYKTWKNGMTLSTSLTYDHNHYKDSYTGTSIGNQRLTTDVTMGLLQLSCSSQNYYYYVSTGVSNSAVILNNTDYNYCTPVAYYGGNYALNSKHAISLNGLFTHTLFDPSKKNSMVIPTSFFETVKGNPDLAPLKVLGNTLTYSGQFGKSRLSVSYGSNIYFDNILHQYITDVTTIFDTHINDGIFYGNMLTTTFGYNAFSDRLRISLTAIEEYNMLRGGEYDMERNIFRIKASATYLIGNWMLKLNYHSPYTVLDIRHPYLLRRRPIYEMLVSWDYKDWSIETFVRNPFCHYNKQHITMDYGCYRQDIWRYSEPDGRSLNLRLTYNLGYGRKQERSDTEIDKTINSAIMQIY